MVKLGDTVKDWITGLVGIAIGRIEYLNGCVRYQVQPRDLSEGKPIEAVWIDEQQLAVISCDVELPDGPGGDRGGPGAVPPPREPVR